MGATLISVLIGGLVTWFASKCYYEKSYEVMQRQAEASKLVTNAMAAFLEIHFGKGKTLFNRDEENNIMGEPYPD